MLQWLFKDKPWHLLIIHCFGVDGVFLLEEMSSFE